MPHMTSHMTSRIASRRTLARRGIIAGAFLASALCGLLAAEMARAEPAGAAPAWNGVQLGLHGGHAWGDLRGTLTYDPGSGPMPEIWERPRQDLSAEGWLGGAHAGFTRQAGSLVWGLEADIAAGDMTDTLEAFTVSRSVSWRIKSEVDALGTVRARLGVLVSPALLVYGTGGVALARTSADLTATHHDGAEPMVTARGSASEDHVGWTAGAGAEWAIDRRWSIRAEWLHVDLGEADYRLTGTSFVTDPPSAHTTDSFPADLVLDVVRVGVSYRFGAQR